MARLVIPTSAQKALRADGSRWCISETCRFRMTTQYPACV